jgi:uncharacterized Zn finger protein
MTGRDKRGMDIAMDGRVVKQSDVRWTLVGDSKPRKHYTVINFNPTMKCDCPNHLRFKHDCKHIKAVKVMLAQEQFGLDFRRD